MSYYSYYTDPEPVPVIYIKDPNYKPPRQFTLFMSRQPTQEEYMKILSIACLRDSSISYDSELQWTIKLTLQDAQFLASLPCVYSVVDDSDGTTVAAVAQASQDDAKVYETSASQIQDQPRPQTAMTV